jgi:acetate---CoA ligase (ADP-forming)
MDAFFNPQGIVLVGATATPTKGGYAIFRNLILGGSAPVFPVNPRYKEIDGHPCYPSVADVPGPADLAILFVPARMVPDLIRDCGRAGIRRVIVESGGFAESGPEGRALQEAAAEAAREHEIRIWGPNCMGLVDAVNRRVFSFVAPGIWDALTPGDVSLVVQSGMLSGAFLIDNMTRGIMGVSKVCSVGNKMDVDECDLLEYLIADPDTRCVGLYLESIPEGRRFVEICRRSPKPVVVLKGGRSRRGAEAAMSHTASMAGDRAVIGGALAGAGVVQAHDFQQMMDICRTLAAFPDPKTEGDGRVAVLTYSGGAGIVSADFMEELGLEPAALSEESLALLRSVFPEWMRPGNPVDLWPAVERNGAATAYGTAIRAAALDPGVDAVLIHAFAGGFALNLDLPAMVSEIRAAGKPCVCWLMGQDADARAFQREARKLGMPVFREVYRAVECLAAVFERRRIRPATTEAPAPTALPASVRERIAGAKGVLDEAASKALLADLGIPTVEEAVARSLPEARDAAVRFGWPVVLKGLRPDAIHKTEAGLVRMGIDSEAALDAMFAELLDAAQGGGVLVQRQVPAGLELIAGLVRDPQFGPCVMVGMGGVLAEALGDTAFGVAPLTKADALALVGRLRSRVLLDGFRGAPPVDREALAEVLVALGHLGAAEARVREVDINPLIVAEGRPVAVDASVVLEEEGRKG